jgi:hypothetical protein
MTGQEVREKYRELLNDINFDKMGLLLKTPNIFQILNISRTEIRHSNFLAWLLDPNGTHGLGRLFLIKFLRDIAASERASEIDEIEIEDLNFNSVELRREWRNIDLLIIFENLVICIENKVDTQDHSEQLARYRRTVNDAFKQQKKIFVYLTPTGEEPRAEHERQYYAKYSYEEIIEQAERVLQIHGKSLNQGVFQYISDYLTTIKRELMKNDELNELADKIYKAHREILDFVIENKSDITSEIYQLFVDQIEQSGWVMGSKNKGYVRFLTPKLDAIIPRKGQGWPLKENFLFEIDYFWSKRKASFKTVISPGDEEIQKVLSKAIENIPEYKKPSGKKWLVHLQYSWKFETEEMVNADEAEIKSMLKAEWPKITEIVTKVETELLKVKDDLLRLKG